MLSTHEALIYSMVVMSAADSVISEPEVEMIGNIIARLPAFRDYDVSGLSATASECLELLSDENGLDEILNRIAASLPPELKETSYALAVEVAAADLKATEEELNLLQMMRQRMDLDRLICAGIERGARARFAQAYGKG